MAEDMLKQAKARDERARASRYEPVRSPSRRTGPSLGSEIARTVVKQLGTRQGQALVRGILGGLFKGR